MTEVVGPGQQLVVSPHGLDDAGAGLCALEGAELHVAGALPGEEVRALVEHRSPHRGASGGRQLFGRTLAVLRSSDARVVPACPGHGQCGGCPLQHLAYQDQLVWKRDRVAAALAEHPGLAGVSVLPCVPSPRTLGYRNQAKYVYGRAPDDADAGKATSHGRNTRLTLGAYAPRSHRLVDLIGCAVVEPAIDQVARTLLALLTARQVVPFDEVRRTGALRYVVLRANAAGQVLCALVTGGRPLDEGASLAEALQRAAPAVVGVVENHNDSAGNVIFGVSERVLAGEGSLREELAGIPVRFGPRAFFQLNRAVAGQAYAAIRAAAERLGPSGRVVDLFAGLGGISFALRGLGREIVAVEENPAATAAGASAAADAGLAELRFVTGSVESAPSLIDGAELVVLNPPRAGAAAVLPAVLAAGPRAVIYLSCNPSSLARDLVVLTGSGKLRLGHVQPFDMLPHTPHIEALAVLESP
jgi:23S rRNA (uracil1939-C5)-methyltransferase